MLLTNFNIEYDNIVINIFGDIHIGSTKCNYELLKQRIKEVEENENHYAIILGDIINNSTKTSVGDVYSEPLSPMQQIQTAVELFRPIQDKIIGVVSGNHERRSYRTDGIDLMYFFCKELRLTSVYNYVSNCIIIRYGKGQRKKVTSLYFTHGDGQGGKTIGGKANGLSKRGQVINADIIVTGHTHTPIVFKESYFNIDERNNQLQRKEQLFVNIGSTLDYEEYAEIVGMRPSSIANPRIFLSNGVSTAVL